MQVRTGGNTICPAGRYRNAQKYVGPLGGGRDPMYGAKHAAKKTGGESIRWRRRRRKFDSLSSVPRPFHSIGAVPRATKRKKGY